MLLGPHSYLDMPRLQRSVHLTRPVEVELAIYQHVIAILDMYPLVDDDAKAVSAQIAQRA